MKDHTCLLDHHQRSHQDTITIGPEGMINWGSTVEQQPVGKLVQQSFGEVQRVKLSQNQPNPNPNQSVIDRGKPEDTERCFCG